MGTSSELKRIGAIVLAAGAGRRLGLGPKAMLRHEGKTFLERAVAACSDCDFVQVVIRPGVEELARLAHSLATGVSMNPEPERGMFSSVQCGLRDVDLDAVRGLVIFPVDHPLVRAETVPLVSAALSERAWVVPTHDGRPGHPIGIGNDVARALLDVPVSSTLREALEQVGAERVSVSVDDPGILQNVNTR